MVVACEFASFMFYAEFILDACTQRKANDPQNVCVCMSMCVYVCMCVCVYVYVYVCVLCEHEVIM